MSISTSDLVQREVIYCVSSMVSTVGKIDTYQQSSEIRNAQEQAFYLYQGPQDYENAARDEGWDYQVKFNQAGEEFVHIDGVEHGTETSWQDICETHNIEPYESEVFEHWIVSGWLADKLITKGETVDKDFMGLTVWARTTTGQAIAMDAVIQEIHAELVK